MWSTIDPCQVLTNRSETATSDMEESHISLYFDIYFVAHKTKYYLSVVVGLAAAAAPVLAKSTPKKEHERRSSTSSKQVEGSASERRRHDDRKFRGHRRSPHLPLSSQIFQTTTANSIGPKLSSTVWRKLALEIIPEE